MTNPMMITEEALEAVYLFIAELMGHKVCTIQEKLQAGKMQRRHEWGLVGP